MVFWNLFKRGKLQKNVPAEGANEVADGACCLVRVWWVAVHLEQTKERIGGLVRENRELEDWKRRENHLENSKSNSHLSEGSYGVNDCSIIRPRS